MPDMTSAPAAQQQFCVDKYFPRNRVHAVGGCSSAGKSRWVIPVLADLHAGLPVLSQQSHALPVFYVACDRVKQDAEGLIARLGYTPDTLGLVAPVRSTMGDIRLKRRKYGSDTPSKLIQLANTYVPRSVDGGLLFIEAMELLTQASDPEAVLEFFDDANFLCHDRGLTITGSMHTPKNRPKFQGDQGYQNTREKIAHTYVWGACLTTIVMIDLVTTTDSPERTLLISNHTDPEERWDYTFEDGKLIPATCAPTARFLLDTFLQSLPRDGAWVATQIFADYATTKSIEYNPSVKRWLAKQVKDGKLERHDTMKGRYRVIHPS